jgi:tRNA threonylcarbamoyladenosine biosynthesis protein TsaE
MFEKNYIYTLSELPAVVSEVIVLALKQPSKPSTVLLLKGDLGAGKTTFVQELAAQLGVGETVTSPTFAIIKQYETSHKVFARLVHMDAYRIENQNELAPLRFTEILAEPNQLLCIEWPERIQAALPTGCLTVSISIIDENQRSAQVSGDLV